MVNWFRDNKPRSVTRRIWIRVILRKRYEEVIDRWHVLWRMYREPKESNGQNNSIELRSIIDMYVVGIGKIGAFCPPSSAWRPPRKFENYIWRVEGAKLGYINSRSPHPTLKNLFELGVRNTLWALGFVFSSFNEVTFRKLEYFLYLLFSTRDLRVLLLCQELLLKPSYWNHLFIRKKISWLLWYTLEKNEKVCPLGPGSEYLLRKSISQLEKH